MSSFYFDYSTDYYSEYADKSTNIRPETLNMTNEIIQKAAIIAKMRVKLLVGLPMTNADLKYFFCFITYFCFFTCSNRANPDDLIPVCQY